MKDVGNFPYVEAKWKTVLPARGIDNICLHSMESPEKGDTAESVAGYFTRIERPASAHLNIDNNSIIRSVHDKDVAYAAPGLNHNAVHFEHAGYARQTEADWFDDYSKTMLIKSAEVAAQYCLTYAIPPQYKQASDLTAGGLRSKGITTHLQVTRAWPMSGDHTDPGVGFPISWYIQQVQSHISQAPPEVVMARIPNIVGKAQMPNGGLYLCGSDGGVFTFHGAPFRGSITGMALNAPIVDIVCYGDEGYWLIGADGGVFGSNANQIFGNLPPVQVYTPLINEYALGARAVVAGFYSNNVLTLVTDDLHDYNLSVG